MKYLVVMILVSLFFLPVSCKKMVKAPIDVPAKPSMVEEPKEPSKIPTSTQLNLEFIDFKAKGELAAKEGRFTDAINSLEQALAIKSDVPLQILLRETYLKRGKEYYQKNDFENALFDFNKCASSNQEARDMIQKIESTKAPILLTPADKSVINSKVVNFIWLPNGLADNYQIQIETESWETYLSKEVMESHLMLADLKPGALYYWRIRAHFPKDGWGVWSAKSWFRYQ